MLQVPELSRFLWPLVFPYTFSQPHLSKKSDEQHQKLGEKYEGKGGYELFLLDLSSAASTTVTRASEVIFELLTSFWLALKDESSTKVATFGHPSSPPSVSY